MEDEDSKRGDNESPIDGKAGDNEKGIGKSKGISNLCFAFYTLTD